jgi:hypothetical protein
VSLTWGYARVDRSRPDSGYRDRQQQRRRRRRDCSAWSGCVITAPAHQRRWRPSHVWGPSFVLVETLKRLAGIEPAWPAWKTAPDAWSGASTCGRAGALCPVSDHGLPPLIVKDANSTPQVVDRELAKLQNPAHRPARPPRTSPLAPTGDAAWLTRRNALVTSPGFSLLLDVRQPDDGPEPILDGAAVCIPSIWRSPTTRQPGAALDGIGACVVWLCPRAGVW